MDHSSFKYSSALTKVDGAIAVFLFVCIFLLALFSMTNNCPWGDDFAAYILQGISIAEGNFKEQAVLNHFMHPSFMPEEASDSHLVYVWGYSLFLALVYKLVGFDRISYSSVIYYKIPSVLALALLAVVLYYFMRERFGRKLSFTLSALFCLSSEFFTFMNSMYSDIVLLFFATFTLYINERSLQAEGRKKLFLYTLLGLVAWLTYEIRMNGCIVLFVCLYTHVVQLCSRRKMLKIRDYLLELLPYLLFFALKIIFEYFVLAPHTPNSSDLKGVQLSSLLANLIHYGILCFEWYQSIWNCILVELANFMLPLSAEFFFLLQRVLTILSLALFATGLLLDGFRKNIHYTLMLFIYLLVVSMLPYNQGLRYIYPLLPLVVMYTGYGCARIYSIYHKSKQDTLPNRFSQGLSFLLIALLCLTTAHSRIQRIQQIHTDSSPSSGYSSPQEAAAVSAYSQSALEAYHYVTNHTPEDSVIAFFKPRLLYLNTQRLSYVGADYLGQDLSKADYYLIYKHILLNPVPTEDFVPVWSNDDFIMLKKQS